MIINEKYCSHNHEEKKQLLALCLGSNKLLIERNRVSVSMTWWLGPMYDILSVHVFFYEFKCDFGSTKDGGHMRKHSVLYLLVN
jgi:hypothetical protein